MREYCDWSMINIMWVIRIIIIIVQCAKSCINGEGYIILNKKYWMIINDELVGILETKCFFICVQLKLYLPGDIQCKCMEPGCGTLGDLRIWEVAIFKSE
jgi:hypothetical protein